MSTEDNKLAYGVGNDVMETATAFYMHSNQALPNIVTVDGIEKRASRGRSGRGGRGGRTQSPTGRKKQQGQSSGPDTKQAGSSQKPPSRESSPSRDRGSKRPTDKTKPQSTPRKKPNKSPSTGKKQSGSTKPKLPKGAVKLGICGTQAEGTILQKQSARSTSPKPKGQASRPSSLSSDRRSEAIPQQASLTKRGRKKLQPLCGVEFQFPEYPDITKALVTERGEWEPLLEAVNAADIDPCKDNYKMAKKPYPTTAEDGVHGFIGSKQRTHDIWQTEHVIDVQIIRAFFDQSLNTGDGIQSNLPTRFRISGDKYNNNPNACSTLEQFWWQRWEKNADPMTFLLEIFPGENEFAKELVLLPGRLNNKKQVLMSAQKKDVIGASRWKKLSIHEKIDELREMVLLAEYFNMDNVAASFKRLSNGIRDRLSEIEDGPGAKIRETDNFWYRKAGKHATPRLKDKANEKYKSFGLSEKWETWIYKLVKTRCDAMYELQLKYHGELKKQYADIKTWPDFQKKVSKAEQAQLHQRMLALDKHIKTKVDVSKLVDRPIGMPPSRQNSGSGSRSPSQAGSRAGSRRPSNA